MIPTYPIMILKMNKNDIKNLDDEIIKIIKEKRFIRNNELLGSLEDFNESEITKKRHIEKLLKDKSIMKIKYPRFSILGFNVTDKRASFLTLRETIADIEHQEEVFKLLESKKKIERQNAIVEIDGMLEHVVLIPSQIQKLSELILKEEKELSEKMIFMIHKAINRNYVLPKNIDKFQKNLIAYLKKYDTGKELDLDKNTKAYVLFSLGLFNNEIVIDMLKRDIKERGLNEEQLFAMGYSFWSLSKIINLHKRDLFQFSNKLDKEKSLVVFRVRKKATDNLKEYESIYPFYDEKIREATK